MPRLSKKFKKEWDFFIHPKTGFVTYNEKCLNCTCDDCKQSYRVKLVACPHYEKKEERINEFGNITINATETKNAYERT